MISSLIYLPLMQIIYVLDKWFVNWFFLKINKQKTVVPSKKKLPTDV